MREEFARARGFPCQHQRQTLPVLHRREERGRDHLSRRHRGARGESEAAGDALRTGEPDATPGDGLRQYGRGRGPLRFNGPPAALESEDGRDPRYRDGELGPGRVVEHLRRLSSRRGRRWSPPTSFPWVRALRGEVTNDMEVFVRNEEKPEGGLRQRQREAPVQRLRQGDQGRPGRLQRHYQAQGSGGQAVKDRRPVEEPDPVHENRLQQHERRRDRHRRERKVPLRQLQGL